MLYASFIFDKIDGDLARIKGLASDRGTYLDSFLDRAGEIVLLSLLVYATETTNALLIGLAYAGPLLFYYHYVAVERYLKNNAPAKPMPPTNRFRFYMKDLFAYNRARHILLFVIAIALGIPSLVFLVLPIVGLYPIILFLKNSILKK